MDTPFVLLVVVAAAVFGPAFVMGMKNIIIPEFSHWMRSPKCQCCRCCARTHQKKKVQPKRKPVGRARYVKPAPNLLQSTHKAKPSEETVGRTNLHQLRLAAAAERYGEEYARDVVNFQTNQTANFRDQIDAERFHRKVAKRVAKERGKELPNRARDTMEHRAQHHHKRMERMEDMARRKQDRLRAEENSALFFSKNVPVPERPPTRPDADSARAAAFASEQFMQCRGAVDAGLITEQEQDAIAAANYFVQTQRV